MRATWTTIAIACGIVGAIAAGVIFAARLGAAWMALRRRVMQQIPGYQARNINAFRSSTVVATVKRGGSRHKVLQVVFGTDGSLYVSFPYFAHRTGLLSVVTFPSTGRHESFVNLEPGGKVTSHLVKYSHHPSGLALFSQTGKVRSEVRRQSVALDRQEGHLFTVLINGLQAFKRAVGPRDAEYVRPERTVLTFQLPTGSELESTVKIVGRWYDVNRLRFANPTESAGPLLPTIDQDGKQQSGVALANPAERTRHVLLVTCDVVARLGADPEMMLFFGGFDPSELMNDTSREAQALAFMYPIRGAEELRRKIGDVDFN